MKYFVHAAGFAAYMFGACSIFSPSVAGAGTASSIQAASYCVILETKSLGKPLPVFGNTTSCSSWSAVSVTSNDKTATVSFSPPEATNLPPGTHTIYLRFQDDQGVWGPARKIPFKKLGQKLLAAAKYFIDTDGDPTTAGTSLAAGSFAGQQQGKVQFSLGATTIQSLASGTHTLYLHFQDDQGVWGPARRYSFSVVSTPSVQEARFFEDHVDIFPPIDPNSGTGRILTASDGTYNAIEERVTGSYSVAGLDFGAHKLSFLARDSFGRWSDGWLPPLLPYQTAFYVGRKLTVSAVDSDKKNGRDGRIIVAATPWPSTTHATPQVSCWSYNVCSEIYPDGATATLSVERQPWTDTKVIWSGCIEQANGSCLTNMDAAKNVTVQLQDTTLPDTGITSQPPELANSRTASFGFTVPVALSEDISQVTYECRLLEMDQTFTGCTSPKTYSGLNDGPHTFYVRAIDKVGNIDTTPASYTWTIDSTPPVTTATLNGSPVGGNLTVTLAVNEPATIYLTRDNTQPSTASEHFTDSVSLPLPTTSYIRFFAVDTAGNSDTPQAKHYVTSYELNLLLSESNAGSVSVNPPGISFASSGSVAVSSGIPLTLNPKAADEFFQFVNWDGNCSGTSDCILQLPVESDTAVKNVTALFTYRDLSKAVFIDQPSSQSFFGFPQVAYNQTPGGVISMWAVPFEGNFVADRQVSVTLQGGLNTTFNKVVGNSVLHGALTIKQGTLAIRNLVIR